MLSSFAITITCARAVNYIRERRRPAPLLRSWIRRARNVPIREQLRVHHFVPGVALAFLAGAGSIFTRGDGRELWFSVPFGVGLGLTFDEVAVMTEHGNTYWKSEKLAVAQAAGAAIGATAITVRLHRRERGMAGIPASDRSPAWTPGISSSPVAATSPGCSSRPRGG